MVCFLVAVLRVSDTLLSTVPNLLDTTYQQAIKTHIITCPTSCSFEKPKNKKHYQWTHCFNNSI